MVCRSLSAEFRGDILFVLSGDWILARDQVMELIGALRRGDRRIWPDPNLSRVYNYSCVLLLFTVDEVGASAASYTGSLP